MKQALLIILLIIVFGGAFFWFSGTEETEDEILGFLENLKSQTGIDFSEIEETEFEWIVKVDPKIAEETVTGEGFEANVVSSEQSDVMHPFFIDNGFETDVYNFTAGTISELRGYKKDKTVCMVSRGLTGYKEAEEQWVPTDTNNWDIAIKCGKLEKTEMEYATEDWQIYENEKYGYSLKYPQPCLFSGLPGYCKQSPLGERPRECLCYFNAEDPNSVSLWTYTGTKSDLTGASFVVFHSIYVDFYSPPAGTDLIQWIKENFPLDFYEDIPDEMNMEIDGIPAVKIYTPRSPQSWSYEDIYFIKNDKVFTIKMLNVDNEDNRALYDKILFTFQFSEVLEKENKIETQKEGEFSVALEANPTTGYQWELDFSSEFIELINREYTPHSDESLVGAGGTETFNFRALKTGETEITFSYLRPWEEEKSPIEEKVYRVIIK